MFEPQVYFASKNLLLMHQVYLYTLTLGKSCNTNTHDDDDNNVEGETLKNVRMKEMTIKVGSIPA
jgi:hypothetical protein